MSEATVDRELMRSIVERNLARQADTTVISARSAAAGGR
jgi:hypothetical protein